MTNEALEKRRAYQREYRRKHPEKTKQYAENYWEKRAREDSANDDK